MIVRTLTVVALFVTFGPALAQPPKPADQPPPKAGDKPDLNKRLAARISLDKYEGSFREAVATVAEAHDLPLVLTKAAEQGIVSSDEGDLKRGQVTVRLPKLTNVKAETVLALLCEQAEAKFLLYPDHIRIVPDTHAAYESGVLSPNPDPNSAEEAPLLPTTELLRAKPLTKRGLVNATFKGAPLAEVLDAIAEQTGANVTLSPAVARQVGQVPVTVRFANAPVGAAVRTLCEMTETGVIEDANVLLVTTRERAAARAKDDAQKLKDKQLAPFAGPGLCGGPFAPPGATADPTAELAKLKEQNEQLAKRVEALTKQIEELKAKK